jgi:ATPase subunit of ABC transporter with duplicated ATPase domains
MIGLSDLGKSYGDRTLFEGVSLKLVAGSRYGLVGANGSGKTTLLEILAGDEPQTEGSVSIPSAARVGVLRQDRFLEDEERIIDLAMMGDQPVWELLVERERRLASDDGAAAEIADVEERLRALDGYTLEARASAVLEGLGIDTRVHREPLHTLSGGFKLRVLLAQVLVGGPDVLLLDEPTNHLDILTIRWLEKFLIGYAGCALVISHDQRFLDNVVTHVLDVDYGTITLYTGNYSAFAVEKQATRSRKEAEIARAEEKIAEKRAFVERFGAKATKAKQAQSRLKQIERIEVEELASSSRRAPAFRFVPERPSGRDVLEVIGLDKAYGDNAVLRNVSLTLRRGEKAAVIGANGLGKSTLLKVLMDRVPKDAGTVKWGHEVRTGYFAQDHKELLEDESATALDVLWSTCPKEPTAYVRGQLGLMLFSGDDVNKSVSTLSGGEAARLIFARISVQRPNVLVLDEPTNHLDLEAIQALVGALRAYEGTLLFVSHDRFFVSELATRIFELTPQGLRDFPGGYVDYLARCGDDHLDAEAVVQRSAASRADKAAATSARGSDWEDKKRRRNRVKELTAKRDAAAAALELAEARAKQIRDLYCEPGFFERVSPAEVAALQREETELGPRIEALMTTWEESETELGTLEAAASV